MCKVEVVSHDWQSTTADAAAASNYFAGQGVHAINGPILSPENTEWKPVANRNNQVNFATSFAADVIGRDSPLNFHKTQSPPAWGPPVLQAVKDHYHLKSVLLLGPNDQDGARIATALRAKTPESRYLGKHGWRGKAQHGINQELSFPVSVKFISNGTAEPRLRVDLPAE